MARVVLEGALVVLVLVLGPHGHDDEPGLGEHVAAEGPRQPGEAEPA